MLYFFSLLVVAVLAIMQLITSCKVKKLKNIIAGKGSQIRKFEKFYWTLVNWLEIKQDGYNLAEWFYKRGYKTVAIYGAKELGERLYEELYDTDIKVLYFIDRDIKMLNNGVKVYMPTDNIEKTDVLVVTAIYYYIDIADEMSKRVNCPIVSLETIIGEV